MNDAVSHYDRHAADLAATYETLSAGRVWAGIADLLPDGTGRMALDIGAGSGRDAAWLSSRGYETIAAEPAAGMREEGLERHPGLRWVDDRLPALSAVNGLGLSFDLVVLGAVWMHVAPAERPRAFRKIVTLLKPGATLLLSLRHGPGGEALAMHPAPLGEIEALARDHGLTVVRVQDTADLLGRPAVSWTLVCLRLPDDGTVGLPLIRGVVLNDGKSSTYKLALLRAVAKIADAAPSLAVAAGEGDAGGGEAGGGSDRVAVPLGLVALNWLRLYLPLVAAGLPQAPGNSGPDGLGFAGEGFRALLRSGVTAADLRVGATFADERAAALLAAMGEARRTIVAMPVRYTRLPNSSATLFAAEGRPDRVSGAVRLAPETLLAWGRLTMPGPLWRTMLHHGAWIDPVLVAEWVRLTKDYALRMGLGLAHGAVEARMAWSEPSRNTGLARAVATRLFEAGRPLVCVWSGAGVRPEGLDIDHALPWSAWPCGDLWNLMPADRRVNQHEKRDRLPSAATLARARGPIVEWWREAWCADEALAERFVAEARAALPIEGAASPETVFAGMEWRRLRVRQDQGAPEWTR